MSKKEIPNWRWCVLYALLAAGFAAVTLIFGEDARPLPQWTGARLLLAAAAAVCFTALCRLAGKWEREGKIRIPEYE